MIQLVKPQNEGKQVQVKRSGNRWRPRAGGRKEERQQKAVREEETGNPTHKRKHYTMPPDNKGNMGTI